MEKLATFLNDNKPLKILDVGTGVGNFIRLLDSLYNGYELIEGIDTSERSLEMGRQKYADNENVQFVTMNALNMTYPDNSFDLVCLSNSLHHLDDIQPVITEMERVTKHGGHLLFAEMTSNQLDHQQKSHLLLHHFAAKIDRLRGETHNDTYTDREIVEVVTNNSTTKLLDSWLMYYERFNERSDGEIQWFIDTIDRLTKHIDDKAIIEEGEEIKKYILKYGFDSCPTMLVVMEK